MFLPQEILRKKRDGRELSEDEVRAFVRGLASGAIADAQIGAFAMAVCVRDMTARETVALTLAMRDSGRVLAWPDDGRPVVDKHSTGGVGDKTSLVLAPLLAACGARVPMVSGRGLGHTGGTLDKLESIPGYDVRPEPARFVRIVQEVGCAIVGQTAELAPADGRLYAIRDVTGTVESIPLVTASILSKKLAAGIGTLVLDAKFGSGAFFAEIERARMLARRLVEVAEGAGIRCRALLTDMDQVLGRHAGNALEVAEAIAMLRGEPSDPRLRELVLALATEALIVAGLASNTAAARQRAEAALASGAAAERFAAMVRASGGPSDLLDRPARHLPLAPVIRPVPAGRSGFVGGIDVRALGLAIVRLGGGRSRPDAPIDHRVGLASCLGLGEPVGPETPLAWVHAADEASAAAAVPAVRGAFALVDAPPPRQAVVRERIGPESR
ncbi:Thymidine phosphorylase [bacterium HR40]|nr:Thymidine phosphorylase [bacterium HR40]